MNAGHRISYCISASLLLVVGLLVDLQSHLSKADDPASNVRAENSRVDITLRAPDNQQSLSAKIRVEMRLRNNSDQRDSVRRVFPISSTRLGFNPEKRTCRVTVDDAPVNLEWKDIVSSEEMRAWPNEEQANVWRKRIEDWFAQDQELLTLVEQYQKLASVQTEMGQLAETFRDRVKAHLINQEVIHSALEVANGNLYFEHLVIVMPEIDPAYRIDGKFERWEYVPLLSHWNSEAFRPYEKEWREKADQWFMSKPDLAMVVPKLRELWKSFREAEQLLTGPILKHLHDVNGLSLPVALQLKSFMEMGKLNPPTQLMRTMFPDIDAELRKQSTAVSMRLRERGFDESVVSPFTGKLMPNSSMPRPFERTPANDETVRAELGLPKKKSAFVEDNRKPMITPMLITFEAPLDPKSEAKVVIEYDTVLRPLQDPLASHVMFDAPEEVMAVFPSPHEVPFSVTCPAGFQPIIAPGPRAVMSLEDGVRRFDGQLNGEQSVVHIAVINFKTNPLSWTNVFNKDRQIAKDVHLLLDRIDNPSVRPLLMTSKYVSLQQNSVWDAHEYSMQIQSEHPDFSDLLDSLSGHLHQAGEAKQLYEWLTQKAKSPSLEAEADLNRFKVRSRDSMYHLTQADLRILADRVGQLKEDSLTIHEKMGRHFILCQAGVDTKENLGALIMLAEANPLEVKSSLKLIQFMTIEKSAALPYVLRQFDRNLVEKAQAGKVKTDSFEWARQNSAYHALRTFRSPECATQLIEFIHSTSDSLLVQGAMVALGQMTLPDQFEELTGIADRVAATSESAYRDYLELLLRSNQDRAVPFVKTLPKRYPALAAHVLRELGEVRDPMALSQALELYRSSSDEDQLRAAVSTIKGAAEPKDIAALKYRKGLPEWMNEGLVSVIRTKGGDASAFPFVEAYYEEFIRGRKKFEHLTCVGAFEQIGDRRAIPYLREIFSSTERKRDAAEAIGGLMLDRKFNRPELVDESMNQNILAISDPNQPEDKRARAWNELLQTPEKSFDRVMVYSRVRTALEEPDSEWDEDDDAGCRFISGFGDVAAVRLLKQSVDCSLPERYRIAHLLKLLPRESQQLIEVAANDPNADEDRRRTAQLALKLREDFQSPR